MAVIQCHLAQGSPILQLPTPSRRAPTLSSIPHGSCLFLTLWGISYRDVRTVPQSCQDPLTQGLSVGEGAEQSG